MLLRDMPLMCGSKKNTTQLTAPLPKGRGFPLHSNQPRAVYAALGFTVAPRANTASPAAPDRGVDQKSVVVIDLTLQFIELTFSGYNRLREWFVGLGRQHSTFDGFCNLIGPILLPHDPIALF